MELKKTEHNFSVCKGKDFSMVNMDEEYCFTGRTDEEYSLVCLTERVPDNAFAQGGGWKAFRIQGVLFFSLIGISARISGVLADNHIGLSAISTYHTDYILTKEENYAKAPEALSNAGYHIL